MITLQDAIERARLAADESGMVSNYTYDQIVDQLGEDDKYAFTMALVDLGIHTKLGSLVVRKTMSKILAKDFYEEDVEAEEDEENDIADEFVKISQSFRRQTPSGLWVPDSYEQGDEQPQNTPQKTKKTPEYSQPIEEDSYFDTEEDYQSFMDSYDYYSDAPEEEKATPEPSYEVEPEDELGGEKEAPAEPSDQPEIEDEPDDEFIEDSPEEIVEALENAGIHVDKDGKVTLYKMNLPGIYTEKVTSNRPIPIEDSLNQLNSYMNAVDKEQQRISDLQDVATLIGKDLQSIDQGSRLKDFPPKFKDYYSKLEKFKYSEKSPDPLTASIAQGISALKKYLNPESLNVRQVKKDILPLQNVVRNLKTDLDKYYQTQYTKYDEKLEIVDALERLKDIKDSDPKAFQNAIRGMGGLVAAMMVEAQMRSYWDDYESETPPVYGSLELEIGADYLKSFFESKMPGQGEQLLQTYLDIGGMDPNSEQSYDLRNDLEGDLEIGTPEGEEELGTEFKVVQGNRISGNRGLWFYDEGDPSVGMRGGWMIDGYEELSKGEVELAKGDLEEDLQRFVDLYAKGEF